MTTRYLLQELLRQGDHNRAILLVPVPPGGSNVLSFGGCDGLSGKGLQETTQEATLCPVPPSSTDIANVQLQVKPEPHQLWLLATCRPLYKKF